MTQAATTTSTGESSSPLPVAVIGCGRMGRLHARVYAQMPSVKLLGVYDADRSKAESTAAEYGTVPVTDVSELFDKVNAVTVAVPTVYHLEVARPLLQRGIACLIEKPLAKDVAEAREIVALAKQHNAIVQVGHIERFNPAVRSMAKLAVKPRFIEVTRISPLTFRSIDVGVVLDMMIHDIDIVLNLAQSEVTSLDAAGVSVIGGATETGEPAEDICNARIHFASGCVANLTASRLAMKTERRLRVFSTDAYISLDYQKKYGIFVRKTGNLDIIRRTVEGIRRGEVQDMSGIDYTKLVDIEELQIDDVEPLRAQLDSFVDAITRGEKPVVSAEDGLRAVELANRIVSAIPRETLE